jgi:hypothetical protein
MLRAVLVLGLKFQCPSFDDKAHVFQTVADFVRLSRCRSPTRRPMLKNQTAGGSTAVVLVTRHPCSLVGISRGDQCYDFVERL